MNYQLILDEEDFKVYYDTKTHTYFVSEDNELRGVKPVVRVFYDVNNTNVDVDLPTADYMGEQVTDDCIIFWGFALC